jgi:hypothetical protein
MPARCLAADYAFMPAVHNTLDAAAASTAAVASFLRGVERRAAILAELQCGDAGLGDQALSAAIETFTAAAPSAIADEWPQLFWTTLLQTPALNAEALAPFWQGDFAPLARLDFGTRAVILLRVVVGLNDVQAAQVFGVEPAEYKQALQRALPLRADGSLDGEAWLALNDEARFVIQHMPPERVAAIARLRDAAIAARPPEPTTRESARRSLPITKPRWLGKLWASIGLS